MDREVKQAKYLSAICAKLNQDASVADLTDIAVNRLQAFDSDGVVHIRTMERWIRLPTSGARIRPICRDTT
jgi:hypothetical protein